MKSKKKLIIVLVVLIVLLAALFGFLFWNTSPRRTLDGFLKATKAQNYDTAMSYVSSDIKASKKNNIKWFLEDWAVAGDLKYEINKEESWNSRLKTAADGTPLLNQYGYEDKEQKPTLKYLAHHYHAYVTVSFDDFEDPVIIKLIRQGTDNSWPKFAQLFRGWKITRIYYQPLTDEDLMQFGEEGDYMDFGDGTDNEFEIDDEGNLVPVSGDSTDDESVETNTTEENTEATEEDAKTQETEEDTE